MKLVNTGLIVLFLILIFGELLAQPLRVGVYQNPPLIGMDESNNPEGFFIDILEHIAQEENWQLIYVPFDYDDGLKALEAGEIDIMPDIAHSTNREQRISFNKTTLLTNWAEVYVHEDEEYEYDDIMDLQGTQIVAQESDYFLHNPDNGLLSLFDELGIKADLVYVPSYTDVFDHLSTQKMELGLVSNIYGDFNAEHYDVIETPIMVSHLSLRYAFSKDSLIASSIIPTFDKHITTMLNDRNSVYYEAREKFLYRETESFIPSWLWKVLLMLAVGITVLGSVNIVLRAQVKRKTAELEQTNKELLRSERQARLAAVTIEASKDVGFWFKPGKPFIQVNQAAIDLLGYSKQELLKMVPRNLLASEEDKGTLEGFRHKGWDGHLRLESKFITKTGEILIVELSLDSIQFEGETYICGFARDISKRVASEAALMKSEERLQLALQAANEGLWDLDFSTGLITFDDRFVESLGYAQSELSPVRDTWRNLIHPDDVDYAGEEFAKAIKHKDIFGLEFRLKNNAGQYVWFLFHGKVTQLDDSGKAKFATGTIVNINDLKTTLNENQDLLYRLQERNKELKCLYKVSQLVANKDNSITDVVKGTVEIIPKSVRFPDVSYVRIELLNDTHESNNFKASNHKISSDIVTSEGKSGEVTIFLDDAVQLKDDEPFLPEEHDLIDAIGKQLGNMVDAKNSEYKVVASILETEDRERKRISKEIHDSLGQTLSAISLNLDMVNKGGDDLNEKASAKLAKTVDLLHLAISESRSISHNLLPVTLDDFGYVVAVENMLESIGDSADIQFNFYSNLKDQRLSQHIELSLFRITQEAVNNIIKHAAATTVTIQLMHYNDMVILTIEDNGRGFDLKNLDESLKFGLNSMKNRAMSVHGTFTLDSQVGKGVIITVHVPLKEKSDENIIG